MALFGLLMGRMWFLLQVDVGRLAVMWWLHTGVMGLLGWFDSSDGLYDCSMIYVLFMLLDGGDA